MKNLIKAGPACLLVAYTLKLVVFGAAMPDALIIAFLCALSGLSAFIEHIKYRTEMQESIEKLNTEIASLRNVQVEHDGKVKEAISYVSNLKLKTSLQVR